MVPIYPHPNNPQPSPPLPTSLFKKKGPKYVSSFPPPPFADKDVHCVRFWDPKLDPRSFAFIGDRLYAGLAGDLSFPAMKLLQARLGSTWEVPDVLLGCDGTDGA